MEIYDPKELAEKLNLSYRTVLNLLKQGDLKGKKVAGKWRVTENQLKQYLEGGEDQQDN